MEKIFQELADKFAKRYGRSIAINIVTEIISEYENNICYNGYDNDHEMWNNKKAGWEKVKENLIQMGSKPLQCLICGPVCKCVQ